MVYYRTMFKETKRFYRKPKAAPYQIKHGAGRAYAGSSVRRTIAYSSALQRGEVRLSTRLASQETFPRRILTSVKKDQVLVAVNWLREVSSANPGITSRDEFLKLAPEEKRAEYRRGINTMLQVMADKRKLDELREALVKGEDLPDGTTQDLSLEDGGIECKYF